MIWDALNYLTGLWADHPLALMIALATLVFPTPRMRRAFGVFDPFNKNEHRRPWLLRGIVFIVDEADKRLFGRQKTGGWA